MCIPTLTCWIEDDRPSRHQPPRLRPLLRPLSIHTQRTTSISVPRRVATEILEIEPRRSGHYERPSPEINRREPSLPGWRDGSNKWSNTAAKGSVGNDDSRGWSHYVRRGSSTGCSHCEACRDGRACENHEWAEWARKMLAKELEGKGKGKGRGGSESPPPPIKQQPPSPTPPSPPMYQQPPPQAPSPPAPSPPLSAPAPNPPPIVIIDRRHSCSSSSSSSSSISARSLRDVRRSVENLAHRLKRVERHDAEREERHEERERKAREDFNAQVRVRKLHAEEDSRFRAWEEKRKVELQWRAEGERREKLRAEEERTEKARAEYERREKMRAEEEWRERERERERRRDEEVHIVSYEARLRRESAAEEARRTAEALAEAERIERRKEQVEKVARERIERDRVGRERAEVEGVRVRWARERERDRKDEGWEEREMRVRWLRGGGRSRWGGVAWWEG